LANSVCIVSVFRRAGQSVLPLVGLLLLASCINTPLPDYYVITPVRSNAVEPLADLSATAIGLGPITIPETLNRPNIVTPLDSNQLVVAEYHRWSEPLRENLSRVLMSNIAERLMLDKLYPYPWLGNAIDYQVRLDVMEMMGSLQKDVYLQVRWQILSGDKPAKLIDTRISDYTVPVSGSGYSPMVAAFSKAVALLSEDISARLSQLPQQSAS